MPIRLNSRVVFNASRRHNFLNFRFILGCDLSLSLRFPYLCRTIVVFRQRLGDRCNDFSLARWVACTHFHRCEGLCWIFQFGRGVLNSGSWANERFAIKWRSTIGERVGTIKASLSMTLSRNSHIFDLIDYLFADQVWTRSSLFDNVAADFGFGLRLADLTWSLLDEFLWGEACGWRCWGGLDPRGCRSSHLAQRGQLTSANDLLLVAIAAKDGALGLAVGHGSFGVVMLFDWLGRLVDGVRALLQCLVRSLGASLLLLLPYLLLSLSVALSPFSVRITNYSSIWRQFVQV